MADHDILVSTPVRMSKAEAARERAREARRTADAARRAADDARKAAEKIVEENQSSDYSPSGREVDASIELPTPTSDSRPTADREGTKTKTEPRRRGVRLHRLTLLYRSAMGAAGILALIAGALSVYFTIEHNAAGARADSDVAVVQAARTQVINLLTVDKNDVQGYSDRVLAGSTGEWHDEFTKNKDAVVEALAQSSEPTVGRVVQAGIEGRDGDTASVLVSATTAAASSPDQPGTSVRMRVNITSVDGQLKLSKVEVVR